MKLWRAVTAPTKSIFQVKRQRQRETPLVCVAFFMEKERRTQQMETDDRKESAKGFADTPYAVFVRKR